MAGVACWDIFKMQNGLLYSHIATHLTTQLAKSKIILRERIMERIQRERESACHFIEQVMKAFSKCLGLDPTAEKIQYRLDNDGGEITSSIISRAFKRPPKPRLSAGRGAQINVSSS